MDNPEKQGYIPSQEQENANQEKNGFTESVKAIDELYQLVVDDADMEANKEKILQLTERILSAYNVLDHFKRGDEEKVEENNVNPVSPKILELLPTLSKMKVIHGAFSKKDENGQSLIDKNPQLNFSIRLLESDIRYILYDGILRLDNKTLTEIDPHQARDLLLLLRLSLAKGNDSEITDTLNFLKNYKNLFERLNQSNGSLEIANEYAKLQDFLDTEEFARNLIRSLHFKQTTSKSTDTYLENQEGLLERIFIKFGLKPEEFYDILDAWDSFNDESRKDNILEANMNTILDLEKARLGIIVLLYREFGIRNFNRYPKSILIAQFDEFKNNEKPYGIILQATHDWNSAFSHNNDVWEDLFSQIKDQYGLRIIEAKSRTEIARNLIKLNRRYGANHKISFAFIGGHGSKNSITLGNEEDDSRILIEDFLGRGVKRLGNFFEPNPTIVLNSCSTGKMGGIGQRMSETYDTKIIAPNIPASLKKINAIISNGNIDFDIKYTKKGRNKKVDQAFSSGKKI